MGTFLVALILLAGIAGAAASLLHDRRRGKCSCGGDCGGCPGCAGCADGRSER